MRIGLLGGSFNPAHDGHRHISLLALELLRLDEVWWMVAPQNPLKPAADMAPFEARMESALNVARHPQFHVTDIEDKLGTRYTADTLTSLKARFPRTKFVWLMGADNLVEIVEWENWTAIFATVPIAIFARRSYSSRALAGTAAQRYARHRVHRRQASSLADRTPPAWVFLHTSLSAASATQIRARRRAGNRTRRPRS
ncbi:MAG: nicotinate-nucleotide adenylyltransferase [Alphaproteobacteria bacterium]